MTSVWRMRRVWHLFSKELSNKNQACTLTPSSREPAHLCLVRGGTEKRSEKEPQ